MLLNLKWNKEKKVDKDSAATGDLNDLINGILKSIQIKELAINNGKFIKSDFFGYLKKTESTSKDLILK